jgi:hypothetical protein
MLATLSMLKIFVNITIDTADIILSLSLLFVAVAAALIILLASWE